MCAEKLETTPAADTLERQLKLLTLAEVKLWSENEYHFCLFMSPLIGLRCFILQNRRNLIWRPSTRHQAYGIF